MPHCRKKHTEITSKAQRGMFGSELARRRAGKKPRMSGITTEELESHLHEAGGKKLPARAKGNATGTAAQRRRRRRQSHGKT